MNKIARRAGWIVIGLGIVDFAHGAATAPAGTITIRIGGLLVGLLMLFGGLRILAVVRWLTLLAAAVLLAGVLGAAAIVPAGLTLAQMRLHPLDFAANCIPWLLSVAVALVAAVCLNRPQLLAAWARAGRGVHSARIPLVVGLLLGVGAAYVEYRVLGGEAAQKASRAVAARLGPGYQVYTNSLKKTLGERTVISATVQAWNEHEVFSVPVHWQE